MLTAKMEKYTLNLFNGMSQRDAYLDAGYSKKNSLTTVDRNACELAKNNKIVARLAEMRQIALIASITSPDERRQILSQIERAKVGDFTDENGNLLLKPNLKSAAVQEIKTERTVMGIRTTLKLRDPVSAIAEHNRMDGIGKQDIAIQNNNIVIIKEVEVRLSEPNQIIQGNNT